ncbi:MAG: radical SAM protein [Caldilineales bacterium]|nr:radical SAM protein [Caldilineales bacterium]
MLLLLNPPSPADAIANREGTASFGIQSDAFAYPPHTLAVVVAACRRADLPVTVLDAVAEKLNLTETSERIGEIAPGQIAVYCSWGTLDADRAALQVLHSAFPDIPLIAIGAGARYSCDELLVAGATHILLGDPELALAALITRGLPPPGIVRARDILPGPHNHAGLIRNPTALPYPAWDAVPWQSYGFVTLFGSRGCDDKCKFCAYATVQGRSLRLRPAKDVVSEMLWLAETLQPPRIIVRDPVFAADRSRAMTIARGLADAGFATPWECESRPEHFDKALLAQMAKAKCTVIKLGLETADPELLTSIGRIAAPQEAAHYLAYTAQVVADAHKAGIRTRVFALVGMPGQTQAHAEATAAYLRQIQPTFVHARAYIDYPRVPLGLAQTPGQTAALLAPLQEVAAERQLVAGKPPSAWSRLRSRLSRVIR